MVVSEDLDRILPAGHEGLGWLGQEGRVPLGYLGDADKTARTFPVIDGARYSIPGDRARLLWGASRMELVEVRPGSLIGIVPKDAVPGAHEVRIENPEVGASEPLVVTVVATPVPTPRLTSAVRLGSMLLLRGEQLRGEGELKVVLGTRIIRGPLIHTDATIVVEVPADASGTKVNVQLGGLKSNRIDVGSHAAAAPSGSNGLAGAVPGQN